MHTSDLIAISACRSDLEKLFAARGTLRLQFPREDLGFLYAPPQPQSYQAARSLVSSSDRNAPFHPHVEVGGRLPHAPVQVCACSIDASSHWCCHVEHGHEDGHAERDEALGVAKWVHASSVDLWGMWPGRAVLLLISNAAQEAAISDAAGDTSTTPGMPCATMQVLPRDGDAVHASCKQCAQRQANGSAQVHACLRDRSGLFGTVAADAVLLRPDGHVARMLDVQQTQRLVSKGVPLDDMLTV